MDVINNIINALISQFDFTYCVIVNIMTYLIINFMIKVAGGNVVIPIKRIVLLFSIIVIAAIYYFLGTDIKVLVNSAILAPVSWSWIFKPIANKLGLDYKQIDKLLN
jgi:hypothetical protein|nr:MAG TPA: hypothetical protein [Crassvirales sp.]